MHVILQAYFRGRRVRQIQLRTNQVAKIGQSEWADFGFPDDTSMANVQLEVRSTAEGCLVQNLNAVDPTKLNGEVIETAVAHHGDEIEAGATTFRVHIESEARNQRQPDSAESNDGEADAAPSAAVAGAAVAGLATLVAICKHLEFSDEVEGLAATSGSADELVDRLAHEGQFQDAIRLRAYLLPKQQSVWWAHLCLSEELDVALPMDQQDACDAALEWIKDPTEKSRRTCEEKAAAAKYAGAGGTLALSAFWSEGSIAPEGSPEVLAEERLTSQGVAASLVTAAYLGDPTKSSDRFHSFLGRGRGVANGEYPLPNETS